MGRRIEDCFKREHEGDAETKALTEARAEVARLSDHVGFGVGAGDSTDLVDFGEIPTIMYFLFGNSFCSCRCW